MAEHPVIFSTEMVIKILTCANCGTITIEIKCPKCGSKDRLKTQTRRIIKPQPIWEKKQPNSLKAAGWKWKTKKVGLSAWVEIDKFLCELTQYCPYGKVGDTLWVREAWCYAKMSGYDARDDGGEIWYRATDSGVCEGPWKPSIHMFRKYARIFLEITNIRVERCKEISDSDIIDEGFRSRKDFYDTIIELNKHKKIKEILDSWFWVINFLRCQNSEAKVGNIYCSMGN